MKKLIYFLLILLTISATSVFGEAASYVVEMHKGGVIYTRDGGINWKPLINKIDLLPGMKVTSFSNGKYIICWVKIKNCVYLLENTTISINKEDNFVMERGSVIPFRRLFLDIFSRYNP